MKVNPEYEALLPKVPQEEFEALRESIRSQGQHYRIIVNSEGFILDGHHRFKACQQLCITPAWDVKDFPSKLLEKKFVIEINLRRRQLNKFQRAKLLIPLLEIEKELTKQKQGERTDLQPEGNISFKSQTKKQRKPLTKEQKENRRLQRQQKKQREKELGIIPELKKRKPEVQSRDKVARKGNLSGRTLEKAKAILEKGTEDLKQRVESGQTSIDYAYKLVKRDERKVNQEPLPTAEFDVIYADPPWAYDLDLRGDPQEHYSVMDTQKICDLKVPSAKDAILFLWATNPKLKEALEVISAWGFTYKTNLVWIKNKFGTGYYFRGQHELLLLAVKGSIGCPDEKDRPSSVVMATVEKHSQKPTSIREMIEQMYPNHKYLELFAREKARGWKSWGNEVTAN